MSRSVHPTPRCPLRPEDPCTLCQMGVTGPQDCGLVYLVRDDPELLEIWNAQRRAAAAKKRNGGLAERPRVG